MPARRTLPPPPREPCPVCAWFTRWLVEDLGCRPGERVRVIEAHRAVVIVPRDAGDEGESASPEEELWPQVVAEAARKRPLNERR